MIKSVKHKGIKQFFEKGSTAGIQAAYAPKLSAMLRRLSVAKTPKDMNLPGWGLHALKGDLKVHFSDWVSGNWRLTFQFEGEDAELVNYQDHHWNKETSWPACPPHPGLTLRDDVVPALGLSDTQAAEQLGVSRVTLSRVLNGRAAISPEMSLRIEAWLGKDRGGDTQVWLAEQTANDMWQAEQSLKDSPLNVQPAPKLAAA